MQASGVDYENQKSKSEYIVMLNAFKGLLAVAEEEEDLWEGVEFLSELRTTALLDRVYRGLNLSADEVRTRLLRTDAELTVREKDERDILIAAYDNLIDFAVAQQYSMMAELPDIEDDDIEGFEDVFYKFNGLYAAQENQDVLHAAGIAYWWLSVEANKLVTYMTQRDERVRDTHAILDGESYPKLLFPSELIPPIEFGCRCYLTTEDSYLASINTKQFTRRPDVNPVFSESLATKGRIFTEHHSYFKVPHKYKKQLKSVADKIKSNFYGH